MADIDIRGDIISNDDKWIYDWYGLECTAPQMIKDALQGKAPGEALNVHINSCGGSVLAGQEIYSLLHGRNDVHIDIQSAAYSAASVIAMAAPCTISPVATLMVHNVAISGASGDYHDMEKNAEILKTMNEALAQAYVKKTGMTKEQVLEIMDKETWITAGQAVEMGFCDGLTKTAENYTNAAFFGMRLTDEMREKAMAEKTAKEKETEANDILKDLDLYGI